ncbi:hypothetical protein ACES2J_11950 [Bdellovibrio bacteriovorus]|uniref:hypothetical protein n=1 Tax=Bdellovibrio bacteriovorus TaxID=959 RepID=UPI0035A701F7
MHALATLFILILALPYQSFAGDEICNGGDVIVCPRKTPRLLDLYERDVIYSYGAHPQEAMWSAFKPLHIKDTVAELIEPIKTTAPALHTCLSSYIDNESFWEQIRYLPGHEMYNVKDEVSYVVPVGCEKKQVALQFRTPLHKAPRYLINHDIWTRMNSFQQAGLIVHEILLFNALQSPHWKGNTPAVRQATAFLLSEQPSVLDQAAMTRANKDLNLICQPFIADLK